MSLTHATITRGRSEEVIDYLNANKIEDNEKRNTSNELSPGLFEGSNNKAAHPNAADDFYERKGGKESVHDAEQEENDYIHLIYGFLKDVGPNV